MTDFSQNRRFKCICQKELIPAEDLNKHIQKPSTHTISKPNSQYFVNQAKVSQRKIIIKSSKSYLIKEIVLIQTKVSRFSTYSSSQSKSLDSRKIKQIPINIYSKEFIVRLKTIFKKLQKQFKSNFNKFLETFTTTLKVLTFSKDKKTLISGGIDGRVRLWCSTKLLQIKCMGFHYSSVHALSVNSSGKYCLSGSLDANICLWNLENQRLKTVFSGHQDAVLCLEFSKDTSVFFSGSKDRTLRIWKTFDNDSPLIYLIRTNSNVVYISWSVKTKQLVLVTENGEIKKLDSCVLTQKSIIRSITSCKLARKNQVLMVGTVVGFILFVNIKTLDTMNTCRVNFAPVNSVDICKIKNYFVSASENGTIMIWNADFQVLNEFKGNKAINCVKLANDLVFSCGASCRIYSLNLRTEIATNSSSNRFFQSSIAISVRLELIVHGYETISLFNLKSMKNICSRSFCCCVLSLAFLRSGILSGTSRGNIYLLDIQSLAIKKNYLFENESILYVGVNSNWRLFVYSTENKSVFKNLRSSIDLITLDSRVYQGKFYSNGFLFVDKNLMIYIFNETLLKIGKFSSYQVYQIKNSEHILTKKSNFTFIFVKRRNNQPLLPTCCKTLKEFKATNVRSYLRIMKTDFIISSLSYHYSL